MIVFDGMVARSAPAYHAALRRLEDGALTDTTTHTSSRAGPSETHLPHPAGPSQAQTARARLPPPCSPVAACRSALLAAVLTCCPPSSASSEQKRAHAKAASETETNMTKEPDEAMTRAVKRVLRCARAAAQLGRTSSPRVGCTHPGAAFLGSMG